MLIGFFLWLAAALLSAVFAADRWGHLGLGLLFLLFTALPAIAYAWRRKLLPRNRPKDGVQPIDEARGHSPQA